MAHTHTDIATWRLNPVGRFSEKRKIHYETLISHLFDELHRSPTVHMNHMKPIFQDLPFYCTKKVPKTTINLVTCVTGVEPTS